MNEEKLASFLENVKNNQQLWALQDTDREGWVVLDSEQYEEVDCMPLWSTESAAKENCVDEWADYLVTEIPVSEWLEYWVTMFQEEPIMIGLDLEAEGEAVELSLLDFSAHLADIERL